MTDLELLELAAKAAEIEWYGIAADDNDSCVYFDIGPDEIVEWNPLTDDGDALRLAVKLGLLDGHPALQHEFASTVFPGGAPSDPYAATRLAIVRAAAEIGRRMQHE